MITFYIDDFLRDVFPEPQRAGKLLPDYYKKLNVQLSNNPEDVSAKRCIPFMEAITSGYIIPLWADLYVAAKDGDIDISFPTGIPMQNTLGKHAYDQLKGHPRSSFSYGKDLMKFISPWVIETPPGVSCLFTTPMNHFETRFKLVDGIVDTDKYYNEINFPFMWTGGDGEFLIEKGTPLVQVFPFVRYDFNKHEVKTLDRPRLLKTSAVINSMFKGAYKKYYWHKRKK